MPPRFSFKIASLMKLEPCFAKIAALLPQAGDAFWQTSAVGLNAPPDINIRLSLLGAEISHTVAFGFGENANEEKTACACASVRLPSSSQSPNPYFSENRGENASSRSTAAKVFGRTKKYFQINNKNRCPACQ